jgi:YD repeat-containing protein
MVTTKQYGHLNRLTSIANSAISSSAISYSYAYNSANQRTNRTEADGSYWAYTFDSLGQVTSGHKYWPGGTPVAGQQFDYNFDDIGNRKTATRDSRTANYSANNLNQYTSRDVPGFLNIIGTAATNATVSMWGSGGHYALATRKGEYFRAELPENNTTAPLWLSITNLATLKGDTNADVVEKTTGNAFLPKTPEQFGYDDDGNLISDGQWSYTWDAENRLIKMAANTITGPQISLQFDYDSQGRRIRKQVWDNKMWGEAWVEPGSVLTFARPAAPRF